MKGIIKGCIHNRSQVSPIPLTLGELSAEIKTKTHKSWGGYWGTRHGPLPSFIKAQSDTFSLLRNKYVILVGTENQVQLPENPKPQTQSTASAPMQQQQQYSSGPIHGVPLNVLAQQQQSQYSAQQQPMGYPPNGQQYSNPYDYQDNGMNAYGQQQQQSSYVASQGHQWQQPNPYNDPYTPQPLPWESDNKRLSTSTSNDWLGTTALSGVDTSSNPFNIDLTTDTTTIDESFWKMDNDDMNPLAIFESSKQKVDESAKIEEQRKKQQEEDAAFARKLQDEEYANARSSGSQRNQSSRIILTSTEIREMAESEIGKDNVRIMAGFSVIKYGREGRPHQRKMWVNSSLT